MIGTVAVARNVSSDLTHASSKLVRQRFDPLMQHERGWRGVKLVTPNRLMIAASALLLSVILALVSAELPPDTPFWQALSLWLVIVTTAVFLLVGIDSVLRDLLSGRQLPALAERLLAGTGAILITVLPLALMCLPIDGLMPDQDTLIAAAKGSTPTSSLLWAWADQYLNLLPATVGVWLFITMIDRLVPEGTRADQNFSMPEPEAEEATISSEIRTAAPTSALARRHPDIASEGLLAIEADEHYVRFHTSAASRHVLCRFRDALMDVQGLPGLQVHRSWWVAHDAVEGAERSGSTLGLKLTNGLTVPVSQTYRRDVEKLLDGPAP